MSRGESNNADVSLWASRGMSEVLHKNHPGGSIPAMLASRVCHLSDANPEAPTKSEASFGEKRRFQQQT